MFEISKPAEGRISGVVVSRSGRRHTVQADDGRMLLADSAILYAPGARVSVLGETIIGTAGAAAPVLSYQEE